ncbi:hypothetical protein ACIPYS_38345 [Kitasatospora sp. NPDC089913]|uniref:hypothetical protein n=1 Tax=Kitasatospora sp. NPDC089913 TaxID=3364080 RepID=UPI00380478EC
MPSEDVSPQRDLYRLYHRIYGARAWTLPALLPEVWLHWDHKTVQQRSVEALLNHRMDFLLLLPGGHRAVLEVDGRHHYATAKAYEDTVRGDRDLKLRGYEVYRFSSTELSNRHHAGPLLEQFFTTLSPSRQRSPPTPDARTRLGTWARRTHWPGPRQPSRPSNCSRVHHGRAAVCDTEPTRSISSVSPKPCLIGITHVYSQAVDIPLHNIGRPTLIL